MTDTSPLLLSSLIEMNAGDAKLDFAPSLGGLGKLKQAVLNSGVLDKTILGALSQALNIDLGTILGQAWAGLDGVRTALKATRDDETAQAAIPLAAHQLKSSHSPVVTLMVAGCPPIDLPFSVEFTLKIDGAELEIAKGQIQRLKSGGLTGNAVVKLAGQALFEKASERLDLPGRIHFKPVHESETEAEAA